MRKFVSYVGRRRGNLVIIEDNVGRDKHNHVLCRVRCDCGTEFLMTKSTFMCPSTKTHCGCLGDKRMTHISSPHEIIQKNIREYMNDVHAGKYDINRS